MDSVTIRHSPQLLGSIEHASLDSGPRLTEMHLVEQVGNRQADVDSKSIYLLTYDREA